MSEISLISELFIIFTAISGILFYDSIIFETTLSLKKCLETIIPSLYGSMIIACLITESRLHILIGKIFSIISKKIFHMPSEIFSVFILANISGYPTGTKLLKNLMNSGDITEDEFEKYCCFCFSSGPAFVSGTASLCISGKISSGFIIFISNIIANLTAAFFCGLKHPENNLINKKIKVTCNSDTIINSINSASYGMMSMCSVITAFSIFKVTLYKTGITNFISKIISNFTHLSLKNSQATVLSLLEITNISDFDMCNINILPLMASIFSTGGICVILQVLAISEGKINIIRFLKYRLSGAFISYIVCDILCKILLKNAVIAVSTIQTHSPDNSLLPSFLLLIMSMMLISTDKKETKKAHSCK